MNVCTIPCYSNSYFVLLELPVTMFFKRVHVFTSLNEVHLYWYITYFDLRCLLIFHLSTIKLVLERIVLKNIP